MEYVERNSFKLPRNVSAFTLGRFSQIHNHSENYLGHLTYGILSILDNEYIKHNKNFVSIPKQNCESNAPVNTKFTLAQRHYRAELLERISRRKVNMYRMNVQKLTVPIFMQTHTCSTTACKIPTPNFVKIRH